MKIFVIHEVSYVEKPVYEYQDFAERLSSRGHEVTVIDFCEHQTSKLKKSLVSKTGLSKIRLVNLPNNGIPLIKYLTAKLFFPIRLRRLIKEYQPDAILLYSVFINGVGAVRVAQKKKIPIVFRVLDAYHLLRNSPIESRLLKLSEKFIYQHVDKLSVTNAKMGDYVKRLVGSEAPLPDLDVLDHGVDTTHFRRLAKDESMAKQLGVLNDDFVCIFLGTTYEFSRLDKLVEAIPLILKAVPNFKLLIIGAGELDDSIANAANQLNVNDRVIQVGMIPYQKLPQYLSLGNIAINPFEINSITRDIVPIKILQYLASELPVVSTPLPDLVLKIPSTSGGIWFSASDLMTDFISTLLKVIELQNLSKAGEQARSFMELNFSINHAVQKLEKALGG
ncbi:hypothetical protein PKF023_03310 [Polynucleobacter yangtzensis]|uniref:Glycosyltransferase subfamily 4-like N-terminal domain-containing protein n=1 Tax=Polynucleobacter yangtzensis TaxID=1743159 RepID=A0A9C7C443_9BURK|nr:glycosyltransferase [Polynucleobacter yangtzensis]BDT76528.1 hypothetical protein PKF023_03310 [Polynucleobacter yangtzensis]